jgi:hypothetical protein
MIYYLVACSEGKEKGPRAAKNLYNSPWFKKARAYTEAAIAYQGGQWFIMSAKYLLLDPNERIKKYNVDLTQMKAAARRKWAKRMLPKLDFIKRGDTVIFVAGQKYREHLVEPLRRRGVDVRIPFEGLGIGEQLHYMPLATDELKKLAR